MDSEVTQRRGQYAPTRKRREEIAAAVVAIVDEFGHEAVTVAAVAEAVDASEGTVLYHFSTKDELYIAALEYIENLEAAASNVDSDELNLDPTAFSDALTPNVRRLRLVAVLRGLAAIPTHPAAAYFASRYQHQLAIFTRGIEKRQQEGLAHPSLDARQVAAEVIALWDGLTSAWLVDSTVDIRSSLEDGFRRLTGENWMRARAFFDRDDLGL